MNKSELALSVSSTVVTPAFYPKRDWIDISYSQGPMSLLHHGFSPDEWQVAAESLDDTITQRVVVPLPDSENILNLSRWYPQRGPSCTVWATINAIYALGVQFNPDYAREAHRYALQANKDGGVGLRYEDAKKIMEKYPTTGIYMDRIPERLTANSIKKNARIIEEQINDKSIILATVNSEKYLNQGKKDLSHAVCIAGGIIEGGFMDLQIIDPARGVIWMSLEHFTDSIKDNRTYTITLSQ